MVSNLSVSLDQETLSKLALQVFARPTIDGKAPILDQQQTLKSRPMEYSTFDEAAFLEEFISSMRQQKRAGYRDWGTIGSLSALLLGIPLVQVYAILATCAAGPISSNIFEALYDADSLNQLEHERFTNPGSYLYHATRHGEPLRRLFVVDVDEPSPKTRFYVQFSDGYVGQLMPLEKNSELLEVFMASHLESFKQLGEFCLSDAGANTDWVTADPETILNLPNDQGMYLPVQIWRGKYKTWLALPFEIPHFCRY